MDTSIYYPNDFYKKKQIKFCMEKKSFIYSKRRKTYLVRHIEYCKILYLLLFPTQMDYVDNYFPINIHSKGVMLVSLLVLQ